MSYSITNRFTALSMAIITFLALIVSIMNFLYFGLGIILYVISLLKKNTIKRELSQSLVMRGLMGGALTFICFFLMSLAMSFFGLGLVNLEKPAIYLYPTQHHQKVTVTLNLNGKIITSYPKLINNSWHVIAEPDGSLVDMDDNAAYKYLFWEGELDKSVFHPTEGFVVSGDNTVPFLKEYLTKLGLIPAEYNDFIVYWAPQLEQNKYNLIYFAKNEYTDNAKLIVSPSPQTMIRVFMVYKPLTEIITVPPQQLSTPKREGFTVVEWGGTKIN